MTNTQLSGGFDLMWTDMYNFIPMQVFSEWLEFRSWGIVDVAMTSKHIRTMWLKALVSFDGASHRSFPHVDLSLRWMVMRKIKMTSIYLDGFVDLWSSSLISEQRTIDYKPDRGYLRSGTFERISDNKLRTVSLNSSQIDDSRVNALAYGCRNITSINLNFCRRITDIGASALAKYCKDLVHINITHCSITDDGLKKLAKGCVQLRSIKMSGEENVTEKGISSFVACRHLEDIYLWVYNRDNKCQYFLGISKLALGVKNIRSIKLDGDCFADNETMRHLSKCPKLRKIKVRSLRIYDADISALANGCRLLENIDFDGNRFITDVGVFEITRCCPLIQKINLNRCNITDQSLVELAHKYPSLKKISFNFCNVTDIGVSAIEKNCKSLQRISFNGCRSVSSRTFRLFDAVV